MKCGKKGLTEMAGQGGILLRAVQRREGLGWAWRGCDKMVRCVCVCGCRGGGRDGKGV